VFTVWVAGVALVPAVVVVSVIGVPLLLVTVVPAPSLMQATMVIGVPTVAGVVVEV